MTGAQQTILDLLASGPLAGAELWRRLGAAGHVTDSVWFWFLCDGLRSLGLVEPAACSLGRVTWKLTDKGAGRARGAGA